MKKKTYYILFTVLVAVCAVLCSCGDDDKPEQVTLRPDKLEITANGTDKVTFRVYSGEQDVTDRAGITNLSSNQPLVGAVFTSSIAATYSFSANYNGRTSEAVDIKVKPQQSTGETFYKSVLLVRFTGTWCRFCYDVGEFITSLEENELKDRIVHIAMHGGGEDPMIPAEEEAWGNYYNPEGYPWLFLDMRMNLGPLETREPYLEAMQEIVELCPATTGFRVDSKIVDDVAEVSVTVKASQAGEYSLAVIVLEDGIIEDQASTTGTVKDYQHNHVLRTSVTGSVLGETIAFDQAGQEVTKTYRLGLKGYQQQNCYFAIYTTRKEAAFTVVDNSCYAAINGITDYRYE